MIYSLGGLKQLNSSRSPRLRQPSKLFSNSLPKYPNCSKEWSDPNHKIDFEHDPLSFTSPANSEPAARTACAFPEAAESHQGFEICFSVAAA